jgi:hypothetical protein
MRDQHAKELYRGKGLHRIAVRFRAVNGPAECLPKMLVRSAATGHVTFEIEHERPVRVHLKLRGSEQAYALIVQPSESATVASEP